MFNQLLKNALCLSVGELLFLTKAHYPRVVTMSAWVSH